MTLTFSQIEMRRGFGKVESFEAFSLAEHGAELPLEYFGACLGSSILGSGLFYES